MPWDSMVSGLCVRACVYRFHSITLYWMSRNYNHLLRKVFINRSERGSHSADSEIIYFK